nr:hypothetical protein [Legionella pneumophila]
MKSTNNMQKKEVDKPTLEQAQKAARRNNAPEFIPGASPYYNLYCFFIDFAMVKKHPSKINLPRLFSMGNKFLLTYSAAVRI